MVYRYLGRSGLKVSRIGFGAFKIGRNEGVKYAQGYPLPTEEEVRTLLEGLAGLDITYVDTAPAYGLSEERVGRLLPLPEDWVVSTKAGETFEGGRSSYDFSPSTIHASLERSCERLRRDILDLVFLHSDGGAIEHDQGVAADALRRAKDAERVRAIGFSGKSVDGAKRALDWADAIMVEYNLLDRSHEDVIAEAAARGIGVVVKKALASGRLDAKEAIDFVLDNQGVDSIVVGSLHVEHMAALARRVD